ncbi:MAG: hypothetical protein EP330_22705 [Deltaproteobacteria bacterium]|nr:MAG: hypothetical protein EP330_22705 [Deltaproteobacteria bacterium]
MLHLDKVIGQGAFGTVFLGRMQSPDGLVRRVAIKLLSKEMSRDQRAVQRFRDEARLLALVDLPGVVPVYGIHRVEERWAVVMGFVDGVALHDAMAAGAMPPSAVRAVGVQVAELLHELHHHVHPETGEALHVVHRDIKPHNLMVEGSGRVRVLDFGVAQARFEARETRTVDGELAGTLAYMSPQRWAREDDGHKGDIYALGVTLLHLISGELPPRLGWDEAAHKKNLAMALGVHADTELGRWIARAAAWNAAERPEALDLAEALRRLQVEGPTLREWAQEYQATRTLADDVDPALSDVHILGTHSVGGDASDTLLTTGLHREPLADGPTLNEVPKPSASVAPTPGTGRYTLPLAVALWVVAALAVVLYVSGSGTPTGPVRVLLAPTVDAEALLADNELLRQYLERELRRPVIFEVGKTYDDVSQRLISGDVHFAQLPYRAGQATLEADPEVVELVQKVVDGTTTVDGYLMVRKTDPATSLQELVGSTVCYSDALSNTGYRLPRQYLSEQGFDPDSDFGSRMSGNHEQVLRDVDAGECRIGGTFSHNVNTARERGIDVSGLRMFAITGKIPHDSVWAAPEADPRTTRALQQALLDLDPREDFGQARLGNSERISGFIRPDALR